MDQALAEAIARMIEPSGMLAIFGSETPAFMQLGKFSLSFSSPLKVPHAFLYVFRNRNNVVD